jgi:DNA polymerase III delta prime subunit
MPRTRLVIVVVSVLLAIATNIAASALPESWQTYTWLAWPAVLLFTVMMIVLSVWQGKLHRPANDNQAAEHAAKQAAKPDTSNRHRMLAEVRRIWIDGYLKHSLDSLVRIELGLEEAPDAVSRPWDLIVQQPGRVPRSLPPDQAMGTTFHELGQALLILGAPGAGKTTLLLELARDLLDRAEQDPKHSIPVVFHLSSWAVQRRPMADWLVDELRERYYVSRKLARAWIDAEQVLPLLDGLDEVAPEHRAACVEAINTFRRQHAAVPLAVCSRALDYEALAVRVELSGAIVIQPLSRAQIRISLKQGGKVLAGVRWVLRDDETLWELLETPLMLSIVALAYQGRSAAEVRATGSLEQRRTHLFENYTQRMFERRTKVTAYTPKQTVYWLTWLARSLMHNNLSVFYVEWMQPEWLASRAQRWIVAIVPSILSGLAVGLITGLGYGLALGLVLGLVAGIIGGLGRITPAEELRWSWRRVWRYSIGGLALGLGTGLILALVYGLASTLVYVQEYGLVVVLVTVLVTGLSTGLILGLILGLVGGLAPSQIVTRSIPNEGIRRSLRNALISFLTLGLGGGLVYGLVVGLVVGLDVEMEVEVDAGLDVGLKWGLISGLIGGLNNGGSAYIKHYLLRFVLWRNDCAPWNYIRFLDHAAERVFLRKVGGGYIFTHRLLMEYFATLPAAGQAEQFTAVQQPSHSPPDL